MNAKRILLLDSGKEWGGGTNSMIELLKRIDRSRFEVTALFYRDYRKGSGATLSGELAAIGIPLRILTPDTPPWWEKPLKELARAFCFGNRERIRRAIFAIERRTRVEPMARRIADVIRHGGFDLLYMNNQPASNVDGYLAAAMAGVPAVQHCRIEPVLTPAVVEVVNRHADAIFCVSDGVRDVLTAGGIAVPPRLTIHNGIDCHQPLPEPAQVAAARAAWNFPSDAIIVGTVGRLAPIKRVGDLLRAVASACQRDPACRLHAVIVGEGDEVSRLKQLVIELGVVDRVRFTGFDPQPLRLVAAMDVFTLSSQAEGLPRVILEAMLLARPVVASAVVGSRELVLDGETGFLFPCADIDAFASALLTLAGNDSLRHQLGAAGAQRVREHFSIERYVAGVESALGEVLAKGAR